MKLSNKKPLFRTCLNSLFLAVYVGLSFFSIRIPPFFEFTIKGLPLILTAIFFGPIDAMIVAACGELICQFIPFINPYGVTPTLPLWLIPVMLRGLIVGLLFKEKDPLKHKGLWILTIIISCLAVTSANIGITFLDGWIMGYPIELTAIRTLIKFVNSIVTAAIFIVIVPIITQSLKATKFIEKDSE